MRTMVRATLAGDLKGALEADDAHRAAIQEAIAAEIVIHDKHREAEELLKAAAAERRQKAEELIRSDKKCQPRAEDL